MSGNVLGIWFQIVTTSQEIWSGGLVYVVDRVEPDLQSTHFPYFFWRFDPLRLFFQFSFCYSFLPFFCFFSASRDNYCLSAFWPNSTSIFTTLPIRQIASPNTPWKHEYDAIAHNYGHRIRSRGREIIQIFVVVAFGLVFPVGLMCSIIWMSVDLQYVWLG